MVDSDSFLKRWSTEGSIWEKILKGSGTPTINLKRLVRALGGSSVMLFLYAIASYIRNGVLAYASLVDGLFEFGSDLVGVVLGRGAVVTGPGGESRRIAGPRDYLDRLYADAASAIQTEPAVAFLAAFLFVLGLATLVLVVRRHAS